LAHDWQQRRANRGTASEPPARLTATEEDDMKITRYLMIAFALATPSMVMAQGTPAKAPPPPAAEAKQQAAERRGRKQMGWEDA
jgi:hypothetical protein